jgi:pimeloyl-ACP methyl ester carboxylesterase
MRLLNWLVPAVIAIVASGAAITAAAMHDLRIKQGRLESERQITQTRHGPIEYATWGSGPPVLVVHGAGGGFDQGKLIALAYVGEGFQWIAPSRFGYLGSPMPADASTAAQADAFADLLDHLGIERVSVLAFSGGAPPALQFAERYPDRTTSLALLSSAPFTPLAPDDQQRPIPDWLYQALFTNDVVYWSLAKTIPGSLEQAFDARPELSANLPSEERQFVAQLVQAFLPASQRAAGVRNEGAAIDPRAEYALENIRAPTLVVHARDDRLNDFSVGVALSQRIPGAGFLPLESGGHLLLGHHAAVRATVASFLAEPFAAPQGPEPGN